MIKTIIEAFRKSHNDKPDIIAALLDLEENDYLKLENGEAALTTIQATILGKHFNVDPAIFFHKGLSVTNYNHGPNSHSGPITTYNNNYGFKELMEKLVKENDELKIENMKLKNDSR